MTFHSLSLVLLSFIRPNLSAGKPRRRMQDSFSEPYIGVRVPLLVRYLSWLTPAESGMHTLRFKRHTIADCEIRAIEWCHSGFQLR